MPINFFPLVERYPKFDVSFNNTDEYQPKSFYESLGLFEHLIDTNSGASKNKSWNFWDREEELSQQIEEGKITEAEADEIRKKYYLESLQK